MRARTLAMCGLLVVGGCVTERGEIPDHPNKADLQNDGSDEAQERLLKRYTIRPEGDALHVGKAVRKRYDPAFLGPQQMRGEVREYLEHDSEAAAALSTPGVDTLIWITNVGSLAFIPLMLLLFIPVAGWLVLFSAALAVLIAQVALVQMKRTAQDDAARIFNRNLKHRIRKSAGSAPAEDNAPPPAPAPVEAPRVPAPAEPLIPNY